MRNLATHAIFPNIQEIPITQTVQNVWYSNPEIYLLLAIGMVWTGNTNFAIYASTRQEIQIHHEVH